jgi:Mannosyltransferase (PIG-V)
VESASESAEPLAGTVTEPLATGVIERPPVPRRAPAVGQPRQLRHMLAAALERWRFAILVYLGSRALLLVLAIVEGAVRHHSLFYEFENWDGGWYRALADQGYQHQTLHTQTTLGFFPLYPMVIWVVSRPLLLTSLPEWHAAIIAGLVITTIGGLIATVLVQRLAAGWWGESAGRRAAALFCLFPGSVVFSMVYAEGIMIPLAVGCILALQDRRWLLAGFLAAFATATEPEAVVLVLVCAVSAAAELHRRGWRSRAARRALVAPVLAPLGLIGVLAFMWAWTGTPFAYWVAQHYGWMERFDPLAIPHLAIRLAHHVSFVHFNHPTINLNWPVGLIGAVVLAALLLLMLRIRRTISVEAWTWTLGISFLALTSEWVPPNPRLLITAFPALIVLAYYLKRRAFSWLLVANGVLLAGMSWVTFVSVTLRP